MRTVMLGSGLALALLVCAALAAAPEAEASPFKSIEAAMGAADVYIGFGYRSRSRRCCPPGRYYVRSRYYRYYRRPVRSAYYYSSYPTYYQGYYPRPYYYGYSRPYYYSYPRVRVGVGVGYRSTYPRYHYPRYYRGHGSRRVVGRRR